ncbi:hypothetical protein J1614_010117 [Plenodomus biglobosus]|nr:hypothetical protein J1614_010117 [Plenodomus biglobosus]
MANSTAGPTPEARTSHSAPPHATPKTPRSDEVHLNATYSVTAIPDGSYGWVIVVSCFVTTFCHNSIINCWGILQAALLDSSLKHVPPSTLAYVGTLALSGGALYGLAAIRLMR